MKYLPDHLQATPPSESWDDWVELDPAAWPRRSERHLSLIPTICFNCESGCGLLAYVDRESGEIRRFEGNPRHPGSRGRVCAKGPATLNQINDPDRILYPLKRVGPRDAARFERCSWEEVLDTLARRIRQALVERRHDEVMYHVGRPGHDKMMHHVLAAWGIDGHNSHTNVCSSAARLGYTVMCGGDRPSPDYANARTTLLLSAHLESGHYFNPHAQRIIEAQAKGGKLIVMDPRLSNTAAKSDLWLPTWPGSEATVLLAIVRHLLARRRFDRDFLAEFTNWRDTLAHLQGGEQTPADFDTFVDRLLDHYAPYTFERAATESGVGVDRLQRAADWIADAGSAFASHVWRGPATGNLGGWQIARALQLLNVVTGSVGTQGGTSLAGWNKFVPAAPTPPPPQDRWNELLYPRDYPLSFHEMSILLPYLVDEGRRIDTYFTRVFNPVWTYPDGTAWIDLLCDEDRMGCHVALTPTWNETARYADFVLPMGHSAERHDIVSTETHAGTWIGFRQPVQRVLAQREGREFTHTWEVNPGEVWEEEEFFLELSWRIDPDGALGIRQYFESPYRPGEKSTLDERYQWIFENSVPGLPEAAANEGLSPLEYMRRYGAFEVSKDVYKVHESKGFATPSGTIEIFSKTLRDWGWPEHSMPGSITSHVARTELGPGEMVLVPTFRLATLIHSRSANSEWLYEISHNNPLWMHPTDGERLGIDEKTLVRVTTGIGHFVLRPFLTEGLLPGLVACSHHLGRWHVARDGDKTSRWGSAPVEMTTEGEVTRWRRLTSESPGPGWWRESGVHQNITFPVHPDPMSGMHCWHQRVTVSRAEPGDQFGDIEVDRSRARAIYEQWRAKTRLPPGELRRPLWLPRSMRPTEAAYRLT